MQFLPIAAAVLALAAPALSFTEKYSLSYNKFYDDSSTSLNNVACSNGEFGLESYGYKTLGDIPTFPSVCAIPQVTGWNSRYCGTCWNITYTDTNGISSSINCTAVNTGDAKSEGILVSLEAMDLLTHGQAAKLGGISVYMDPLSSKACHLPDNPSQPGI